ncbi:MAG: hypothetical protein ACI4TP_01550 [Anaerotignum sp.]
MSGFGTRGKEMEEWLLSQGVVFSDDWRTFQRIKRCFGETATFFPELFDKISVLYVYDQNEQRYSDGKTADAIFWYYGTPDYDVLFAVGISTTAASLGERYTLLCVLHELSHLKMMLEGKVEEGDGHSSTFHHVLDNMISKFNKATGRNIENDYFGLNERSDSNSFILSLNNTRNRKK